jgi:hypothetical protein
VEDELTDFLVENRVTGEVVLRGLVEPGGVLVILGASPSLTDDLVDSLLSMIRGQIAEGYDAGTLEPPYYEWSGSGS